MNTSRLDELIDGFLQGKLTEEEKTLLNAMTSSDQEAARQLQESKDAYVVLQQMADEKMRDRLKAFDQERENARKSRARSRIIIPVLLVIGFLLLAVIIRQTGCFFSE